MQMVVVVFEKSLHCGALPPTWADYAREGVVSWLTRLYSSGEKLLVPSQDKVFFPTKILTNDSASVAEREPPTFPRSVDRILYGNSLSRYIHIYYIKRHTPSAFMWTIFFLRSIRRIQYNKKMEERRVRANVPARSLLFLPTCWFDNIRLYTKCHISLRVGPYLSKLQWLIYRARIAIFSAGSFNYDKTSAITRQSFFYVDWVLLKITKFLYSLFCVGLFLFRGKTANSFDEAPSSWRRAYAVSWLLVQK